MDVSRRRIGGRNNVVAAGSVWESRIKIDEGKGGIKVFNGEENDEEIVQTGLSGKRKTWKSEGFEKIPILIAKGRSDSVKNCDEDGIKKRVIHGTNSRSEGIERIEKSSVRVSKSRSESVKGDRESDAITVLSDSDQSGYGGGGGIEAAAAETETVRVLDENSTSDAIQTKAKPKMKRLESDDEEIKEINMANVKKTVIQEKLFHQISTKQDSNVISGTVKKQLPITNQSKIYRKFGNPKLYEHHRFPETQNKLQSLVDLVMWKEISRSAFVFGVGTFFIITSSYTNDPNISFTSVFAYLGLAYLAAIFMYRSIICRGNVDKDDSRYVLREDEAIWLTKLVLPYFNEFLSNLKDLFSGDPAITMKMAILLFLLGRFGSYITIWKMTKLGFFGSFIVPKICSSYSKQLAANGTYWVQHIGKAWDWCSYKKVVAAVMYTVVWNLSSDFTRIWAVLMVFVAVRYYQQNLVRDDDNSVFEET